MKTLILTILLLFNLIFNASVLWCQETISADHSKHHTAYAERSFFDGDEETLIDDKNVRVRILEWIIKHNISKKYQRIDEDELVDMLEEGR